MKTYQYIDRQAQVDALLPVLMEKPSWGLDTETTGLDPFLNEVILLQIGDPERQWVIDTRKVKVDVLKPFFESEDIKKLAWFGKFDYKMIKASLKLEVENWRDLYLAERLIHNGRFTPKGFYTLEQTLKRYEIPNDMDKSLQTSFIDHIGEFSDDQILYAARDVMYLHPLGRAMTPIVQDMGIDRTWLLECRVMPAFSDMELEGVRLDVPKWSELIVINQEKLEGAKRRLDEFASPFCPTNLFGEVEGIDYNSPKQLVSLFQSMGLKVTIRNAKTGEEFEQEIKNTDKATQKKLKDLPVMGMLKDYREAAKRIGTYGQIYIDAIHPKTGRIHCEVDQIGTETGRPANRGDVTLLGIPKDNRYRNCFSGSEGYLVETDDYAGCELRILAELSQEPRWVEAFLKGMDMHCVVASDLYRVEVKKDKKHPNYKLREPAKSLNFGLAYGMGPGRLYDELNGAGFPITFEEAKALFRTYKSTYKYAIQYLEDTGRLAQQQGWIKNMNGRRRYFNLPDPEDLKKFPLGRHDEKFKGIMAKIGRDGANFTIQSVNADMTKLAMIKNRKYKKQHGIRTEVINMVYDELVTSTHKDDSPAYVGVKRQMMIDAAHVWLKTVPMEADGHVGLCWHKG